MTAADLARTWNGWPVEARPKGMTFDGGFGDEPTFDWLGDIPQHGGSLKRSCPMDFAIDLACMSGLRWLAKNGNPMPDSEYDFRCYMTIEAIDAAIRAVAAPANRAE